MHWKELAGYKITKGHLHRILKWRRSSIQEIITIKKAKIRKAEAECRILLKSFDLYLKFLLINQIIGIKEYNVLPLCLPQSPVPRPSQSLIILI